MNGGKLRGSEWSQESILTQLGVKNWTKYRVFKKQPSCLFCVCRNMGNFVFKTPLRFLWNPDIKVDAKKGSYFSRHYFRTCYFCTQNWNAQVVATLTYRKAYATATLSLRCRFHIRVTPLLRRSTQAERRCYALVCIAIVAATQAYAALTQGLRRGYMIT